MLAMFLKYLIILIILLLAVFLVWRAFVKDRLKLEEEVHSLTDRLENASRELDEMSRSRLNVVGLNPVLHVAVMNIDTSFVRSYTRQSDDGKMTFQGSIRADICAEYGIRMEEVRFRYDSLNDVIYAAGFNPGLIAYSKKQLVWETASSVRKAGLLHPGVKSVSDKSTDAFTSEMCDRIRVELEKEIDSRRIEEFDWLSPFITRQVTEVVRLVLGRKELAIVPASLEESNNPEFVDIATLRSQLADASNVEIIEKR